MDGINDISGRIRLMRSVIGRKIMEMDLFNDKAEELKGEYAVEFSRRYSVQMGRAALVNQMAIDILMADERFAALIGNIVLENPELQNIIENDGESAGFSAIFETVSDSS